MSLGAGTRASWESFLIEITGNILAYLDEDGRPLLRKILDTASQKGTGKWTAVTALQEGTPLTLIGEAVSRVSCPPSKTSAWRHPKH